MTAPIKLNLKVYQGSTFTEVLRWESGTKIYVPITGISKAAPMIVTAPGHSIPVGWRANISNVAGMKEANALTDIIVTDTTSDTVTFNDINSLAYNAYTSGGILEYNEPVDLTGYTARMQIREKITSDTVIQELTTENGYIELDTILNRITIQLPASITQNFSFTNAVYSLELVKEQVVTPLLYGNVSLVAEVTR